MKSALPLQPRLVALLRVRVWIAEHLRPTDLQLSLFWAGIVGLGGGLAALGFRALTRNLQWLFTQHGGSAVAAFEAMPLWQRVAVPAVGGLIAGLLIYLGPRLTGSPGASRDFMEAVLLGDGRIGFRASIVKSLSALFSISTGASIGREGPLVQLSALVASLLGKFGRWPAPRRRLLVACGAAAGIAAAYNAPIAAALFVAEILLGSLAMESFGPLVFASVVSTLTVRQALGPAQLYLIPVLPPAPLTEVIPALVIGLLCGLAAPAFLALLRTGQAFFTRVPLPALFKPALGGLLVGVIAIWCPQVCGNGETVVSEILQGQLAFQAVAVILLLKLLATGATFGSGAVGGVFTPTLFVGASLGALLHYVLAPILPGMSDQAVRFALVGMGAFLAGTTHAPMMAVLMLFELTLDYQVVLPLMPACVVAYFVARGVDPRSVYSESLRGRDERPTYESRIASLRVGDLMKSDPPSVRGNAPFEEVAQTFLTNRFSFLYVTDARGIFQGAVSLHDVKNFLGTPELARLVIADELRRDDFPTITPEVPLPDALERFAHVEFERLPVVSAKGERRLLGSLSKTDLILALADRAKANTTAVPIAVAPPAPR